MTRYSDVSGTIAIILMFSSVFRPGVSFHSRLVSGISTAGAAIVPPLRSVITGKR
jgi:hypothetical protein